MATKIKSSNIEAAAVTSEHLHNDTVTGLTEVTTLDYTNDFTLVYDASDSSLKKIQAGNFAPPLDLSAVDQHIIPDGNELYDLGEPENKFRDLYLSTGTIHMGTTKMSIDTTTGDMVIKGADDLPRGIKAKSVELDDVSEDATFKTVMRKENGKIKFVKVNRSTGIEGAVEAADLSSNDTDDVSEGSTNLYYTDDRVRSVLTTDSIANESYVDTAISNLIGGAPAALDTLNELAAAIGDDDDYAASVTTSLGTKAAKATTISAGTGLTGGGDLSADRTLALAASGVTAGTYGSSTAIPVLVVDTYGRITSVSNTNITVGDGTLTVASGSGLSGSGTFTANQTTNGTITLSHADTSSASSVNNSGSTVIQDITLDGFGHITAIGSTDLSSQFLGITAKAADSDLLDGISSASFLRSDTSDTATGRITFAYDDDSSDYSQVIVRGSDNHSGIIINPVASKQAHIRFYSNGTEKWQWRSDFQSGSDVGMKLYSWDAGKDVATFDHNGTLTLDVTNSGNQPYLGLKIISPTSAGVGLDCTATGGRKYEIQSNASGQLIFYDRDASAYRMYLDSSGNLGIGGVPAQKLDVNGTTQTNSILVGDSTYKIRIGTSGEATSSVAHTATNNEGIFWHTSSGADYGIYRTSGAWSSPNFQQLKLKWITGIVLDPGSSYGKSYVDVQGKMVFNGSEIVLPTGTSDPTGQTGSAYFNTSENALKIKGSSGDWGSVLFSPLGSENNPATSKADLDGNYSNGETVYIVGRNGSTQAATWYVSGSNKAVVPSFFSSCHAYYDFRSSAYGGPNTGADLRGNKNSFSVGGQWGLNCQNTNHGTIGSVNTSYSFIPQVKWGSSGSGFVFNMNNPSDDDGITRNGNAIGNRTHGGSYALRGNYVSNLNGSDYTRAVAFGYTPRSDYANFWSSTGSNLSEVESQGGSYDSMSVSNFYLGSNFDPVNGEASVMRLCVFSSNLSDSQYSSYIQELNNMPDDW